MKTLVLCRHAKSDWSYDLPDIQRPLNNRGRKDAPRMGKLLKSYGLAPDLILSSPAVRARTTAEAIGKELGFSGNIRIENAIYHEGHGAILGLVQDLPDSAETVMVFGHNPILEHLAAYLLQARAGVVIPTCGIVCFEFHLSRWSALNPLMAQLKWFLIPRLIKHAGEF